MAVERPRRTFAIERSLQRQAMAEGAGLPALPGKPLVGGGAGAGSGGGGLHLDNGGSAALISELMAEIRGLRLELAESRKAEESAQEARPTTAHSADALDSEESQFLRIEIARMIRSLAKAKREIAEIKHPMADDDRVQQATTELDAIVGATERATHRILDSAERINESAAKILETTGEEDELAPFAHKIENEIFTIIESCNFQDITGQRIHRVVTTLEFIEARIKKIIEDWGVDAFADLPIPATEITIHSSDDLVDGPQLENVALSQDDIDALFG